MGRTERDQLEELYVHSCLETAKERGPKRTLQKDYENLDIYLVQRAQRQVRMKSVSNNLPVHLPLLRLPPQPEILVETKEKPVRGPKDGKVVSGGQLEKHKAKKWRSPCVLHPTAGFRPKQLKSEQWGPAGPFMPGQKMIVPPARLKTRVENKNKGTEFLQQPQEFCDTKPHLWSTSGINYHIKRK